MTILAIDPGTVRSGWVELAHGAPTQHRAIDDNDELLAMLWANRIWTTTHVVIERFEARGMGLGDESIQTILWTGRFIEAARPLPVYLLRRSAVKIHLCGSARAKDANVRAALVDRFGGKDAAIGRKAAPGPLYGVTTHLWAALAAAVTVYDEPELAELLP